MMGARRRWECRPFLPPWSDTGWSTPADTSRERDESERGGARERGSTVATVPGNNYFAEYFAVNETGNVNYTGSGDDRPVAGITTTMNEPPLEGRVTTDESACAPYCGPTTDDRMTTNESACSTDCEPSTDDRLTTDESACATDCELTTDTTYPTRPATENENPNEASEDANETTNETSEDVSENSNEGRVNAAILESQPNVSVRHITIVYEVFGLGRSARRRTDLKGGGRDLERRVRPTPARRGSSRE
ncbi:hypothetical protein PF006_g12466 [Phytophthora fragariae]|uniref:Uncharacterized protein n=1 Tax=Phytophthora fragariae TaxID=53985 RepID=A0A6A3TT26_9STRA|nr:hypothetical protein PF006_g12466 [Phytophthora fragariae]